MRIFKKALCIMFSLLFTVSLCCACGETNAALSPEELASHTKSLLESDIEWTNLAPEQVMSYFGFDGTVAEKSAVYIDNSEEHIDTVAFFDFKNTEDMNNAIQSINTTLAKTVANYNQTIPYEAQKIQKRLLYQNGNSLCLIISALTENVTDFLSEKGFSPVA